MSAHATDSLMRIPQGEGARGAQAQGKGAPSAGQGKTGSAGFAQILGEQVSHSVAKAKLADKIADKFTKMISETAGGTPPTKSDFGMPQTAPAAAFASVHVPHATVLAPQTTAQVSHATVLTPQPKAPSSSLAAHPSRQTATEQPEPSTRAPAPNPTAVKQATGYNIAQTRREVVEHTSVDLPTAHKEQLRFPGAGPAGPADAGTTRPSAVPKTEVRPEPAPTIPSRPLEAVPAPLHVPVQQTRVNPPAGTPAASSREPARAVAATVETKPGTVTNASPPRTIFVPNQTNTLQARAHFEMPAPRPLAETPTANARDNASQARSRDTMGAAVRDSQNRKEQSPKAAPIPVAAPIPIQAAPVPTQDKIANTVPEVPLPMAAHTKATVPAPEQVHTPWSTVSQRRPETAPTAFPSTKLERDPAPPSAAPQPAREAFSPPKQGHPWASPSIKAGEASSTLPLKSHPSTIPAPAPQLAAEVAGPAPRPSVPSPFTDRRPEAQLAASPAPTKPSSDFTNNGSAKPVKESSTPATIVRTEVTSPSHAPVPAAATPANLKTTNADKTFRPTAQPNHSNPVAGGTPPKSHAEVRHSAPTVATGEHPATTMASQHPLSAQAPQEPKAEPKSEPKAEPKSVPAPGTVPEAAPQAAPSKTPARSATGPQATVPATIDKDHPTNDTGRGDTAPKPVVVQTAAQPAPAQPSLEKPVILAAKQPPAQPAPDASPSASKDPHPIPSTTGKRRPRMGDDKPSDENSAEPAKTLPSIPGPALPVAAASADSKHAKPELPHTPERTTPTDSPSQSSLTASAAGQPHLAKDTIQPALPSPSGQPATIPLPGLFPPGGNDWQSQDLAAPSPLAEQRSMLVDQAALDPGLSVTVMPHSAHLSLSSDAGDLSLHVRVRDGSADVNVTGTMAPLFDNKGPEMRSALAGEGLQLGSFATDQRGGSQGQQGQQGHQGQPDAAPRVSDAPPVPSPRRTSTSVPEARSADDRRIHVTA